MTKSNYINACDANLLAEIRHNDAQGHAKDAFLARYDAKIKAVAKILAYKVNFDYSMSFEERKNEALSEAYILADELVMSHDCRISEFMTNFGLRLKWRLLTMQREYFIREACLRLSVVLPKGSVELDTFNALAKAFHDEEAHPYEVAAKAMGCSRQMVYRDENITAFAVPYCNVA